MITTIIPPQNFEIVRDRIASILASECINQSTLLNAFLPHSGDYLKSIDVRVESNNPIDKIEIPVINVSVIDGNFSDKHQGKRNHLVNYAIDIYTSAKTTIENGGDKIATFRLQKLIGLCFYVLDDPIYKTLNFPIGVVGRTYVSGFQIRPISASESGSHAMGRLTFNVLMVEENILLSSPLVTNSKTTMIIDNVSQGYFIENQII